MSSSVRAALSALPLSRERRLSGKTPVSSGGTKRRRRGNAIAMIPSKCEDDDGSKTNFPEERKAPTTLARGKTRRRDVLLVATTTTAASIVEISSLGCVFPPVASASVGSSPAVTNTVFFEFAIDGQRIGRVVVGVYGDTSVTAQRFLTLTKGIRGLSYRRKPIIGIEKNEDDTKANEETPLWITSAPIAKFEAPGTGDAIDDVPGGLTNEEVVKDVGKIKHDRANLVSVQVREDPRMPKPEPKSKLVSNRGKFERVYEPLPPEPNGTSFSITRDLGLLFSDTIPKINSASRQQSPEFKRRETERLLLLLQSTQQIRRYHRAEEKEDQKQEAILEAESTGLGMYDLAQVMEGAGRMEIAR